MRLTLVADDGTVLNSWVVSEDFGDVSKPLPGQLLKSTVIDAILNAKPNPKTGAATKFKVKPTYGTGTTYRKFSRLPIGTTFSLGMLRVDANEACWTVYKKTSKCCAIIVEAVGFANQNKKRIGKILHFEANSLTLECDRL